MPEEIIKKTDFEKQKKELKKLLDKPTTDAIIDKFETSGQLSDVLSGGIGGFFTGHKITGEEMNKFVTQIQECFMEVNNRDKAHEKELGIVYKTFESLDKEYISGILTTFEEAEKANEKARNAQKDTEETVKTLQKTVNVLERTVNDLNNVKESRGRDEEVTTSMRKKIKIAYAIAGGSICLSLIQMILLLIGAF